MLIFGHYLFLRTYKIYLFICRFPIKQIKRTNLASQKLSHLLILFTNIDQMIQTKKIFQSLYASYNYFQTFLVSLNIRFEQIIVC